MEDKISPEATEFGHLLEQGADPAQGTTSTLLQPMAARFLIHPGLAVTRLLGTVPPLFPDPSAAPHSPWACRKQTQLANIPAGPAPQSLGRKGKGRTSMKHP